MNGLSQLTDAIYKHENALITIASTNKINQTTFACSLLIQHIIRDKSVAYISLAQMAKNIYENMDHMNPAIDLQQFDQIKKQTPVIDDTFHIHKIESEIYRMAKEGITTFIIDNLEHVSAGIDRGRAEEYGAIYRILKAASRTANVKIIVFDKLSKMADKMMGQPGMHHLKHTSTTADISNMVVLLSAADVGPHGTTQFKYLAEIVKDIYNGHGYIEFKYDTVKNMYY